jgi:hypothetical protein
MSNKLQTNLLIYMLPIIIGMLWRIQRMHAYFMKDTEKI